MILLPLTWQGIASAIYFVPRNKQHIVYTCGKEYEHIYYSTVVQ